MSADLSFTAAMVQMRTGLLPRAEPRAGHKRSEAAAEGADYVLTPEVSNMIQSNRKAMFEHLAAEEDDLSLKAYRALAAELKIHLHIGSLALRASPERAVNRSFLIGPDGMVIASYDKIHMFDIDLPGGESYRESANYQPGETAVIADLPWGRIGLTICYDLRFPALYRALAESGASFLTVPSAFTERPAKRIGTRCCAPAPSKMAASCSPPPRPELHENKRETYGHSLIVDPWGDMLAEGGATSPAFSWRRSIPPRSRPRARPYPRCSMAGASASPTPRRAPNICTWCGDRHDPVLAAMRARPRVRELVSKFVGL